MKLNKKILSVVLVLSMLLSTAALAAEVPAQTFVVGDKAYDFDAFLDEANLAEILEAFQDNGYNLLFKLPDGGWINAYDQEFNDETVELAEKIILKKGDGTTEEIVIGEPSEGLEVVDVSAINPTTVKVTFNGEVEELAKADVVVTNTKTSDRQYVKEVTLAEDNKSAEVEFYDALVTKNTYKLAIDEMEKEFDYVVGDVTKIEAETTQVVETGKSTALEYKVLDENGLDITDVVENISFETTKTAAIDSDGKITLGKDETAFVYVVYKAGLDDEVKSARITVKAEDAKVVKLLAYTLEDSMDKAKFEADDFEAITNLEKGKTKTISVFVENQFGEKEVATDVEFESLNKEIALVDRTKGDVTPLKEGSFDVRIKVGDVNVVRSLKVVADAELTKLELEEDSINISNKLDEKIEITGRNQYGDKFADEETVKATIKSGDDVINLDAKEAKFAQGKNKVEFTIKPIKDKSGTAIIEFAAGDVKTTLTVNVQKAGDIDGYIVEGAKAKLDLNTENKDKTPKEMTLSVFGVDAEGVKVGSALGNNDFEVDVEGKDADGKKIDGGVTVKDNVITAVKVGNYTAKVKVGNLTVATKTFEVVNTTPKPEVEQTKSSVTLKTSNAATELVSIFKVDGKAATSVTIKASDNTEVVNNQGEVVGVGEATLIIEKLNGEIEVDNLPVKVTVEELAVEKVSAVNEIGEVTVTLNRALVGEETAPVVTADNDVTYDAGTVDSEDATKYVYKVSGETLPEATAKEQTITVSVEGSEETDTFIISASNEKVKDLFIKDDVQSAQNFKIFKFGEDASEELQALGKGFAVYWSWNDGLDGKKLDSLTVEWVKGEDSIKAHYPNGVTMVKGTHKLVAALYENDGLNIPVPFDVDTQADEIKVTMEYEGETYIYTHVVEEEV